MLGLNSDNYKISLKECLGKNWVYHLRPVIDSIKLPEFFGEEESRTSMRAVWTVAVMERERRCKQKSRDPFPTQPAHPWVSWIERTVKEEA